MNYTKEEFRIQNPEFRRQEDGGNDSPREAVVGRQGKGAGVWPADRNRKRLFSVPPCLCERASGRSFPKARRSVEGKLSCPVAASGGQAVFFAGFAPLRDPDPVRLSPSRPALKGRPLKRLLVSQAPSAPSLRRGRAAPAACAVGAMAMAMATAMAITMATATATATAIAIPIPIPIPIPTPTRNPPDLQPNPDKPERNHG